MYLGKTQKKIVSYPEDSENKSEVESNESTKGIYPLKRDNDEHNQLYKCLQMRLTSSDKGVCGSAGRDKATIMD